MNPRTYALSTSLAATIALLFSVVRLVRNVLEYRSPGSAEGQRRPAELDSLDSFILAHLTGEAKSLFLRVGHRAIAANGLDWQAMYDAEYAAVEKQEAEQVASLRRIAVHNVAAYGTLCALAVLILVSHLIWARRV